jgi:hypothetical protein
VAIDAILTNFLYFSNFSLQRNTSAALERSPKNLHHAQRNPIKKRIFAEKKKNENQKNK